MAMSPNVLFLFSSRAVAESSATVGRIRAIPAHKAVGLRPSGRYNAASEGCSRGPVIRTDKQSKPLTAADRALEVAQLPATARGLADQLRVSRQAVERTLRALVSDGRLVKGRRGPGGHIYHRPGAPPGELVHAPAACAILDLLAEDRFTPLSELLPRLGIARTYASTLANELSARGLVEKVRRSGKPFLRLKVDTPAAAEPTYVIAESRRAILEALVTHGALSTAEIRHHTCRERWASAKVPLKVEMQILRKQALIEAVDEDSGRPRYRLTKMGKRALKHLSEAA